MNLKPIVDDLHKLAFTLPGIEKDDLIKVNDVILILRNHLEFYEQEGSALVHFPDGKVVEKTNSGKTRIIREPDPNAELLASIVKGTLYKDGSFVKKRHEEFLKNHPNVEAEDTRDADIPQAETELPPEILANLNSLQSGTMDEHSEDRKPPPPGTAPA